VNLARWVKVEPESALREANQRFRRRFERMEAVARARGVSLGSLELEQLDKMWKKPSGTSVEWVAPSDIEKHDGPDSNSQPRRNPQRRPGEAGMHSWS
jgi:hypothetical protein